MLGKKGYELLRLAYNNGRDGKYLVSLSCLKEKLTADDVPALLTLLCGENLIDVLYTDRHGEPFVYITLTPSGVEKVLGKKRKTRELGIKIMLAAISAIITYALGKLLYFLFS